ncbi:MAG: PBP1A family penicillin-binding protein [Clostridiales bacterium]|nr:PBP1A family penicillin-binding protein [Clostridiales bacterium]
MNRRDPIPTRTQRGKRINNKLNKGKIIRIILATPLIGIAILLTMTAYILGVTVSTWKELDISKLENIQESSFIYDLNDEKITSIHGVENRIKVSLSEVPKHVQDAFIATEDIRFYKHPGFDIKRLASSLWQNIKARAYVQGGGTITQQVVRNAFLSQKKVMSRKIQEIYLAYQLEKKYTKEQILETYLNLIYFGKGTYGVEAAANRYFGKSIKEVSVAEGAMLAGIIKNPGRYSPLIDKESSMKRKDLVIDLMVKNGYLSQEEGEEAKKESIELVETPPDDLVHSFFIDMVLEEAADILSVKEETLFTNGYKIYTTLDKGLQEFCENIFQNTDFFPKSPVTNEPCQGALVVLDSKTGEVRALLGGRADNKPVRKAFNRATQSRRQPGSVIKPLVVYAPAIESFGYSPVTFIEDAPFTVDNYSPSNYGGKYQGWITLRKAVAASINIPAVKVLHDIGIDSGISFAKGLGIPFADEDNSLSVALGGFHYGISPIELARAYTTLADGGKYKDYTTIRRIEDPNGVVVYEFHPQKVQYISEESAFLINNILQSTIEWQGGTARRLQSLEMPMAAKTGTVQLPNTKEFKGISGTKDAWIAVYNPEYVLTIWLGFDETNSKYYLPSNAVGGSHPAEIAKEVMKYIYASRPVPDFEKPTNVVEVELDGKSLNERHLVLLASPLTPKDQIVLEYFKRNNVPREQTDYWVIPDSPKDFEVILSANGLPTISFVPTQYFAVYSIYKSTDNGEAIPIHRIEAGNQGKIQWTDALVNPGETYSYYAVASHPGITIDGEPVQSPPTSTITVTIPNEPEIVSGEKDLSNQEIQSQEDHIQENQEEEDDIHKISIQIP